MLIRSRHGTEDLAEARQALLAGDVEGGIAHLAGRLQATRTSSSPQEWREYIELCVQHPVRELLHQDPFTRRCYDKPRGYAGDAALLDYVYRLRSAPATTSFLGQEIFRYTTSAGVAESLRTRRVMVSEVIDRIALGKDGLSALSVACGHLREAHSSGAVRGGRVSRLVGVDQDPRSLSVVKRELAPLGVRAVEGTVKMILQGRLPLGTFHLVYAVGLYDYLVRPVAVALTARLFQLVEPGGTLLIPNLTPDVGEVGYMEAFMDWHMIYRDEAELELVASAIDPMEVEQKRLYREPDGNVVFLEIRKR